MFSCKRRITDTDPLYLDLYPRVARIQFAFIERLSELVTAEKTKSGQRLDSGDTVVHNGWKDIMKSERCLCFYSTTIIVFQKLP